MKSPDKRPLSFTCPTNDPDSWGVATTSGFEDKSHVDTDGASENALSPPSSWKRRAAADVLQRHSAVRQRSLPHESGPERPRYWDGQVVLVNVLDRSKDSDNSSWFP